MLQDMFACQYFLTVVQGHGGDALYKNFQAEPLHIEDSCLESGRRHL